ncbi:hypothetical protein GCM10009654_14030 [Streptomyces hebeiensis]|uniref:Uncharacterized protein n=1 Tax=Streptomyces hebeiensis TaxID=229486 RepID=A0ABN1UMX5_9ACTN
MCHRTSSGLAAGARTPPIRLEAGPAVPGPYRSTRSTEEHPVLEAFFSALLVLVCVGVLAFAGLTVKKLYQGQR